MSLSSTTMAAMRFGYGFAPGQDAPRDADALIAQVQDGADSDVLFPDGGVAGARARMLDTLAELAEVRKAGDDDKAEMRRAINKRIAAAFARNGILRVCQAVVSPTGFNERLATFWCNHFAIGAQKATALRWLAPLYEVEVVRPKLGGSFRNLLQAAIRHPAMLIYLDQTRSLGPQSAAAKRGGGGLNENLGRELIELHTLGAEGPYGQGDVRSAALVLTGLTVQRKAMKTTFREARAEPGELQVLNTAYDGLPSERRTLALLDDLADHPATAQHICRKLVRHFIADDPPEPIVSAMTQVWKETDGDLTAVYAAMLDHPRSWQEDGAKMKTPFDFVVSGLRALGAGDGFFDQQAEAGDEMDADAAGDGPPEPADRRRNQIRALTLAALRGMGQPVWLPPSPAGFSDDSATWLSPSQLSLRIAWARRASGAVALEQEPRAFLKAALADAARENTITLVSRAPDRRTGLALALASPEFNRR